MNRKPLIWAVVISLVVLVTGGGAYYAYAMQSGGVEQALAENEITTQTAVAQKGDLSILVSGSGQLVALDETSLKFDETGTLTELLVSLGDEVTAGTVLARLRVDKTEAQLAAEIAAAELEALEAQQALDALSADADLNAAQALYNLEAAQDELADLQNNDLEVAEALQAVAAAQEAVEDADMALYIYNSSPSEDAIYTAYASLLFKEKKLAELQDELDHLEYEYKQAAQNKPLRERIDAQIDRVTAQVYNQQVVVDEARYRYETIDDPADEVDVNVAQTQMDTAQAQLAQANQDLAEAQQGSPAGDIAEAEAAIADAQAEWERWKDGPDPEEVALAETRLEAAQLELQLTREESLTLDLVAPVDGTVISIDAVVDQMIDGDTIITLADISQLLVELSMDETDYQSVQIGNRVEVVFDALSDDAFSGSIVNIAPSLESSFEADGIKAWAVLDDDTIFAKPSVVLPIGLNAAVDVIEGEVTDGILIPIEALHEDSSGNYTVYVLVDDTFEVRDVTVGLMDYTSAAITSGLEAGEIVAIEDVVME